MTELERLCERDGIIAQVTELTPSEVAARGGRFSLHLRRVLKSFTMRMQNVDPEWSGADIVKTVLTHALGPPDDTRPALRRFLGPLYDEYLKAEHKR